ncbi:FAD-dependent monooxygenase [Streptomyces sp. SID13666]|uniref:FAD-dependent oxidoreductase n=1 Tax=Streptomyces TaxID=1883 RepID=UPI001105B528|nr:MULTISPECIES: NAD(P)/FAD-dependent oxidoreductase [Streptomyces]NEA53819.1 FAD-dependent monooxygenase [Streptomyces sp. SID13666]NEA76733.1 FAD-dependent monooxygenase [Streptomyces sp. SID13588]QNA76856.1 FAD-dependent monooxygenase [Streptomyces sp. So13.3]
MRSTIRTALVIGGGIGGPVAAIALHQAGIEATVYEAYDSRADGVGGGLGLAPNGLGALDVIGVGDLVRAIGTPTTHIVLQSWNGKRLGEFGSPPGVESSQFVWRADLYRVLYDEAARRGVRTVHGKRLVSAQESDDGVTAHFADGTTATADVLIGADGIRSTVRSLIDSDAPQPNYGGLVSFGAPVRNTGLPPTGGKMYMMFGKRAFLGYQVHEDSSGVWFVNLPHPEPMTVAEAGRTGAEEWLRVLAGSFTGDRVPAADLLLKTDPADLLIAGPMENMPRVPAWSRGRMVLIGDAAHAASSSSGQGASLAMESAVQLARCLRDLPHEEAFAAYEDLRRPRVERIIKEANRTNSNKAAGPVGRVLRDLLLPLVMKLNKPEKSAWQAGYRIDWDAPVTAVPHPDGAAA